MLAKTDKKINENFLLLTHICHPSLATFVMSLIKFDSHINYFICQKVVWRKLSGDDPSYSVGENYTSTDGYADDVIYEDLL